MAEAPPDRLTLSIDRALVRTLAVALLAGVVLAATEAFGMTHSGLAWRLAYWLPLMAAATLVAHFCSLASERWLDPERRPWLTAAIMTLVASIPITALVWGWTAFMLGQDLSLSPEALFGTFWRVVLVTAVLSLLSVFLERRPLETHAAPEGAPAARFPDRLPVKLRGAAIRAVESEDHYLRVHTDRGSDLILMRLSDAVAELKGLEGAQVHRSWWVARDAVLGAERGEGRATLKLVGGLEAPVSRRYARALREAGWF